MTRAGNFQPRYPLYKDKGEDMEIRCVVNTLFSSCTYVIMQGKSAWLVDCGDVEEILPLLDAPLRGVLLTHTHFDHIYGLNRLLKVFPEMLIFTNEAGKEGLLNDKLNLSRYHEEPFVLDSPENIRVVEDGQLIELFDGVNVQAVYTPGHSTTCVTWLMDDAIFTGDSYIPGVKTVTIFPHAEKQLVAQSEETIRRLAVNRNIFPGHAPQMNENDFI